MSASSSSGGNVFQTIRNSVCAVGYSRVPADEYKEKVLRQPFDVVGTGFIFAPGRVLTCAHVVESLDSELRKKRLPPDRAVVQFVLPLPDGRWTTTVRSFVVDRKEEKVDAAVLAVRTADLSLVAPLQIAPIGSRAKIGEEIGVCGYAHGTILLRRGDQVGRFGPIAQRGIVAALSPFDIAEPRALLLDLTTGHAASGSPVFRLTDGVVMGMLIEGQEGSSASISVAAITFWRDGALEIPWTHAPPMPE